MKKRKGHIGGNDFVVLLAYFHRYGCILLMLVLLYTVHNVDTAILAGSMLAFYGLYDIIGALYGFRHIYCSMQNIGHQKMTPSIQKHQLTPQMKKELFSLGAIFTFMGLALLIMRIFFY